jgi:hypothetical protein
VYVYFVLFSFIIKHLDARTIKITSPPGEVIKPNSFKLVEDEGMPTHGRSFIKGRLYIKFEVGPSAVLQPRCMPTFHGENWVGLAFVVAGDTCHGCAVWFQQLVDCCLPQQLLLIAAVFFVLSRAA